MIGAVAKPKSMEEIVAMPDDGIERWFVRGELKEAPVSWRNRNHSRTLARVGKHLDNWLDSLPSPRGEVHAGDVAVVLDLDPETSYGLDAAYFSAEEMAKQSEDWTVIHGAPVLAVEILSPSNSIKIMSDKIDDLLAAGTLAVWILDPHFRSVTIYQPELDLMLVNSKQVLEGGSILPGFRVKVSELFS